MERMEGREGRERRERREGELEASMLGPWQSFGEKQEWSPVESALARTACVLWSIDYNNLDFFRAKMQQFFAHAKVLARVPAFEHLTSYEQLLIAYSCETIPFASGLKVVKKGERVSHFYIVVSGSIITVPSGYKRYSEYECFGDEWIVEDKPSEVYIMAENSSVLLAIPKFDYLQYVLPLLKRNQKDIA